MATKKKAVAVEAILSNYRETRGTVKLTAEETELLCGEAKEMTVGEMNDWQLLQYALLDLYGTLKYLVEQPKGPNRAARRAAAKK